MVGRCNCRQLLVGVALVGVGGANTSTVTVLRLVLFGRFQPSHGTDGDF